ncbi:fumarylacetoacetate hydrolase family protein [Paenibacillus wulumuqiensis]|uniref:fumarylacetoacetate hydrolase family protein n=1 Tax=Paenibacillus wulumuqiensis TaxID=1567107 RepID=UPI000619DD73|nr:fumarylacetoacetate hydrolase family protein [Paenibacillus wulumuqiensis]
MTAIQNVYCVGRNYRLHAEELGNEVPTSPMIFLKPSHAAVKLEGAELKLPFNQGGIHYEAELVVRIGRDYEPGMTAEQLVDGLALGIDFTLRDVQTVLKQKGHPWTAAKGFKNSAPVTEFIPFPDNDAWLNQEFALLKNGQQVQLGSTRNMIFPLDTILAHIGETYGLAAGDIIFTGTPEGVGPVAAGDTFELIYAGTSLGTCRITE